MYQMVALCQSVPDEVASDVRDLRFASVVQLCCNVAAKMLVSVQGGKNGGSPGSN